MAIIANSTDKSAPRGFPWVWHIRLVQILLTLIILAIAGRVAAAISDGDGGDCHVPPKVAWNIACSVIAFLALIYFLLATGPSNAFRSLPWLIWIQLGLDAFMLIIWIAAAATSPLNCTDLCNACPNDLAIAYTLSYDDLWCTCDLEFWYFSKRSTSLESRRLRAVASRHKTGILAAKTAINALMVVLFAITLGATIFWILRGRQQTEKGTAGTATGAPPSDPEYGVPMVTTQNQGTVVPGGPQVQQQQQQSQYPTIQGLQEHSPVNQAQPHPAFFSSPTKPPPLEPQVPSYDQIAPPGPHPQAHYELPQETKY